MRATSRSRAVQETIVIPEWSTHVAQAGNLTERWVDENTDQGRNERMCADRSPRRSIVAHWSKNDRFLSVLSVKIRVRFSSIIAERRNFRRATKPSIATMTIPRVATPAPAPRA